MKTITSSRTQAIRSVLTPIPESRTNCSLHAKFKRAFQAGDGIWIGGGNLRGDAAAHRLAADREPPAFAAPAEAAAATGRDDAAPARFQLVIAVGKPPARFAIDEVEGDGFDAACGQRAGELHHETAALVGSGAVGEDQGNVRGIASRRRIDDRGHLLGRVTSTRNGSGMSAPGRSRPRILRTSI